MRQKSGTSKDAADKLVRGIKRKTRKHYSAEEKIRIVLAGLRGEESIAALCRREGIAESLYYSWSKEFLEAGKGRLAGDTARLPRIFIGRESGWRSAEPGTSAVWSVRPSVAAGRGPAVSRRPPDHRWMLIQYPQARIQHGRKRYPSQVWQQKDARQAIKLPEQCQRDDDRGQQGGNVGERRANRLKAEEQHRPEQVQRELDAIGQKRL